MQIYLLMWSMDLSVTDYALPGEYNTLLKVDSTYIHKNKAQYMADTFNLINDKKGVNWYVEASKIIMDNHHDDAMIKKLKEEGDEWNKIAESSSNISVVKFANQKIKKINRRIQEIKEASNV